jgi:hypothetical protein
MKHYSTLLLVPMSVLLMGMDACSTASADMGNTSDRWFFDSEPGAADLSEMSGDCAPVEQNYCGTQLQGDTSDYNSGTTSTMSSYPVSVGNYSGPELSWLYYAERSGWVTWQLIDAEPTAVNHDVFVLSGTMGSCLADGALARGFNEISFEARAGESYFLVIDGYNGDAGRFEAALDCESEVEAPAPPPSPAPSLGGDSCADLVGMWEDDEIELLARCSVVLEPSLPDSGWFSDSQPIAAVEQADLCLAHGSWGYDQRNYFTLSGRFFFRGEYGSSERLFAEHFWSGEQGDEHGLETNSSIDLRSQRTNAAIIEETGDWVTEAVLDKYSARLHVRMGFDPLLGGFELHHQFLLQCRAH